LVIKIIPNQLKIAVS